MGVKGAVQQGESEERGLEECKSADICFECLARPGKVDMPQ